MCQHCTGTTLQNSLKTLIFMKNCSKEHGKFALKERSNTRSESEISVNITKTQKERSKIVNYCEKSCTGPLQKLPKSLKSMKIDQFGTPKIAKALKGRVEFVSKSGQNCAKTRKSPQN